MKYLIQIILIILTLITYSYPDFSYLCSNNFVLKNHAIRIEEQSRLLAKSVNLDVSPNPFNGAITISVTGAINVHAAHLRIYSITGKLISDLTPQLKSGRTRFVWSGNHIAAGIYMASLQTENSSFIKKIVLIQ